MAQIDLKHATVVIRDGSANTPTTEAVGTGGAAVGATTMPVAALTGPAFNGSTFHIAGDITLYHIVGNYAASATSIRFQPGLQKAAVAAGVITFFTGGNELEVRIGDGNLTYTEKRNIEYRKNRGLLDTVREGDQETVEVSFDAIWEYLRSATGEPVTVEEALKRVGAASAWVSTSPDPCEPYCVDLVIQYNSPCANIQNEIIVLEMFRWDNGDHNLKDGTLSFKGQCNITQATVTRVAQLSAPVDAPQESLPDPNVKNPPASMKIEDKAA